MRGGDVGGGVPLGVLSASVAFGVRGTPAVLDDVVGKVVLLVLGCNVLFGMLEASRP
ncbi:hypothetical protein [Streptomyces griseoruber]|uniref:hypothetical protein n=1 Tax=Streptomyces griseoruber TaxID=1943 RepID=UPI0012FE9F63|nr:hypothetical protein [Streptomyces griseoruber]